MPSQSEDFARFEHAENMIITLTIQITISSIEIGLKDCYFQLFTCRVVIGKFVIGQFVIGPFNKPITFKVVV